MTQKLRENLLSQIKNFTYFNEHSTRKTLPYYSNPRSPDTTVMEIKTLKTS